MFLSDLHTLRGTGRGGGAEGRSSEPLRVSDAEAACPPSPRPGEHIGVTSSSPQAPLKLPPFLFQAGSKNEGFQPLVEALSAIPKPSESGSPGGGAWG